MHVANGAAHPGRRGFCYFVGGTTTHPPMQLSETWFVEGHIDFELQQYRVLAYLQDVERHFAQTKLYPQLSDLILHYRNLIAFREQKGALEARFPTQLKGVDPAQKKLLWEKLLTSDAGMQELEDIVGYAIEQFKPAIESGSTIYEYVEKEVDIEPVGVVPLYKREGYLLLRAGLHAPTQAYRYTTTLFEEDATRFRGLRLQYLDSWQSSVTTTAEHIKRSIIRANPDLPQPAVYRIETSLQVPLAETLLPIAKRLLVRYIGEDL